MAGPMASALTRTKVKSGGTRYTRPELVEAEINVVLTLPDADRRRRGREQNPTSADYLRSETIVHLLRLDMREGGSGSPYFTTLIKRCQGNLDRNIRASIPQAAQLREEILQEFSLILVEGLKAEGDALDFFECQFNAAFMTLRATMVTAHLRRIARQAPQPMEADEEDAEGDLPVPGADSSIWTSRSGEDAAYLAEVKALVMTFPADERRAIALHRIKGYSQKEAGRIMGVDERTIRNLLERADRKLAGIKGE